MPFTEQDIETIRETVQSIEQEYRRVQGLILSEHDLECLIYHKLFERFSEPQSTTDASIQAIALHAEVSWYNQKGMLYIRPDVTILDPSKLSILHGVIVRFSDNKWQEGDLPTKGFEFEVGNAIVIEIKFCHSKNGPTRTEIAKYRKDIEKLHRLMQWINTASNTLVRSVFVIFNKADKRRPEFETFLHQAREIPDLTVIYGTGDVQY
jgi:hypothetical protein